MSEVDPNTLHVQCQCCGEFRHHSEADIKHVIHSDEPIFDFIQSTCPETKEGMRFFYPSPDVIGQLAALGYEPDFVVEPDPDVVEGFVEMSGVEYHPATFTELGQVGQFGDELQQITDIGDMEW